jgi:hypothetical protein
VEHLSHYRACDSAGILLRLRADDVAAVAIWHGARCGIATRFASDTLSITVMEIVDNLIIVVIPGAMDAGLGSLLFWGSLAFALAVAFVAAFPVNRYLIPRSLKRCWEASFPTPRPQLIP